jgi:hypothetical protein
MEAPKTREEISQLESGLRGAAQGITLGFADEIEAKIKSVISDEPYEATLQKVRDRFTEAQETNPWTYGAGAVGASILPGGLIAKGVGGAVRAGAAIGAIEAAGTSEESVKGDIKELAGDVVKGAAIGGALGLAGRGFEKVVAPKIAKSFERSGLLHKTPTTVKKEALSPVLAEKVEQAVKKGEDLGLWGGTFKGTLKNVQNKIVEVGKELGDTSKGLPELFKENLQLTDDVLSTIDKGRLKLKAEILKEAGEAALTADEARRSNKIIDEAFSGLVERMDDSKNALESLRGLRIGLSKRLKGADYQFGGTKSGTQKDTVKRVIESVRGLENEVVNNYIKHTKDPAIVRKLSAYNEKMDTYSKLKLLEEELATTAAKKGEEMFSLKDMVAGSAGLGLFDVTTGGIGAAGTAAIRHAASPKGKLVIKRLSEKMGITEANVKRLIESGKIPASMLTAGEVIGDK